MIRTLRLMAVGSLFLSASAHADCLPVGADLKSIPGYMGSYTTTISDQDRQNSSGAPVKGMKAFLQQDRANVNRFNKGDPNDQQDSFFTTPQNRQLFQSAQYRGRCGKDYVELVNALDQPGRDAKVDVHVVKSAAGLILYVELADVPVAAQAVAAPGPSFDCAKAGTPVEHSICDNPSLAKLDAQLAQAYKQARAQAPDPNGLRSDQRAWVKSRNQCGANVDCLRDSYNARLTQLGAKPPVTTNSSETVASAPVARPHTPATPSSTVINNPAKTQSPASVSRPRPAKSFTQTVLDRIGPDGWAFCASSQVTLSAINARDGSLPKNAADANRELGRVLGDVRQLLLSQGFPSRDLDKLFSISSSTLRSGDQAFQNVMDCLERVNKAINDFDAARLVASTQPSGQGSFMPATNQAATSVSSGVSGGQPPAAESALSSLAFLFDPRKRWIAASETDISGQRCSDLLARNRATMVTHQYTSDKTFIRIRVGGQHPRRQDPNVQKHGSRDTTILAAYAIVSDDPPVVSFVAVTQATNSKAVFTTPWKLDMEKGTLTRTARVSCKDCSAQMQNFVNTQPKNEVKYWCAD